jgi:DNA-binding transcriptional LysR family regulator
VVTVADFWLAGLLTAATDLVTTVPAKLATAMASHHNLAVRTPPIELPGLSISANWHRRFDDDPRLIWLLDIISSLLSADHAA